jgi:hypothetical protein
MKSYVAGLKLTRKANVETVPVHFQKTQLSGTLNRSDLRIFVVSVENAGTGSRWGGSAWLGGLGTECSS